jgi:SAM-dependent methyltransferase
MNKKNPCNKYYFDHPEIWEEMNQERFESEPKLIFDLLQKYGNVKILLDVGCGTGAHFAKLHELGINGVGIDLNKKMVDFATKKYPTLKFAAKDMRKLDYINKFDAVICLYGTFSYNMTNEDVVATLRGFFRALKKGGILVIDLLNAIGFIPKQKFKREIEVKYANFNLQSVTKHSVNENEQTITEDRTFFSISDNKEVARDISDSRLFFPQEVRYFLETNGFEFLGAYGDYGMKHKPLDESRMIIVAKKAIDAVVILNALRASQ